MPIQKSAFFLKRGKTKRNKKKHHKIETSISSFPTTNIYREIWIFTPSEESKLVDSNPKKIIDMIIIDGSVPTSVPSSLYQLRDPANIRGRGFSIQWVLFAEFSVYSRTQISTRLHPLHCWLLLLLLLLAGALLPTRSHACQSSGWGRWETTEPWSQVWAAETRSHSHLDSSPWLDLGAHFRLPNL